MRGLLHRPVSPAEFAVRFDLEPMDVERLMRSSRRGLSDEKLWREIHALVARLARHSGSSR